MGKNTKILIDEFKSGVYEKLLHEIYVDESMLAYQTERYIQAIKSFEELYGEKEVSVFSAPGRSEVCGNHTDHQFGKVLATSINLDVIAVVAKTDDMAVTIKSEGYAVTKVDLKNLAVDEKEFGTSKALIRGVAAGVKEAGYEIGGFEGYATSDVLSGSGMSSSAAYEVLMGTIFSGLFNEMKLDPVFIAKISQKAENAFFGKPCGLLDQMACSVGGLVHIDFADPQKPEIKRVHVDFEPFGYSLCIVDTKGSHAGLTADYAAVSGEMKKVAAYFGKEVLRDVTEEELFKNIPAIRKEAGDRSVLRAIHWFEEMKRVDAQVEALESGDFEEFKRLIKASGASSFEYLQNVYSTSKLDDQSIPVGLAVSQVILDGKGVSRVHGGGFAGTIQAFVPNDMVAEYRAALDSVFGEGACMVLKVRPMGGVQVVA